MASSRIAILGLGRSGLAVGRAARERGDAPVIFDETTAEKLVKKDVLTEAISLGLTVVLGRAPFTDPGDGFDFLVINPAVRPSHPAVLRARERGVEVIGEIEYAYRIARAPIVAVTGTNGKSTTTVMTYLMLRHCGVDAVLCGNVFGSGYSEMTLSDAARIAGPEQVLVAEVSSFQLEFTSTFHPIAAAITNIAADHLDRHRSLDAYRAAKLRLFANLTREDTAVYEEGIEVETPAIRVPVSSVRPHSIAARDLPEGHQQFNAAVAEALTRAILTRQELPSDCLATSLDGFEGLAHRMEVVGTRDGVQVINNSMCTNPAAVVSSVRHLPRVAHLLMGGVNKDLDFAPLRDYLAGSTHRVYLFGTDAEDLQEMLSVKGRTYRTMQEAFKAATDLAAQGDTIILAPGCASTDQFSDFRHRGDVFKAIAMEWLNR